MNNRRQTGAALVVGLVLMLALTIVAIAAMRMTHSQVLMSGNDQFHAQALNAAEAAITAQIMNGGFATAIATPGVPGTPLTPALPGSAATATSSSVYINQGPAPDGGFSDDILTFRFRIDATGQAPAVDVRARANLRQGLYILAPGS